MVTRSQENITSGPIVKTIFSLAIPVVLGTFMETILLVVNFFWVGKLGPAAQDAVTVSAAEVKTSWPRWTSPPTTSATAPQPAPTAPARPVPPASHASRTPDPTTASPLT